MRLWWGLFPACPSTYRLWSHSVKPGVIRPSSKDVGSITGFLFSCHSSLFCRYRVWRVLKTKIVASLCFALPLEFPSVCFYWLRVFVCVSRPAVFLPSLCSWTAPPAWALPWQVTGSLIIHPHSFLHTTFSVWMQVSGRRLLPSSVPPHCICLCLFGTEIWKGTRSAESNVYEFRDEKC